MYAPAVVGVRLCVHGVFGIISACVHGVSLCECVYTWVCVRAPLQLTERLMEEKDARLTREIEASKEVKVRLNETQLLLKAEQEKVVAFKVSPPPPAPFTHTSACTNEPHH